LTRQIGGNTELVVLFPTLEGKSGMQVTYAW
jgi:hypothetical protein